MIKEQIVTFQGDKEAQCFILTSELDVRMGQIPLPSQEKAKSFFKMQHCGLMLPGPGAIEDYQKQGDSFEDHLLKLTAAIKAC